LIEVKGIGDAEGSVLLSPNERRVAQNRRDCYWLYVVTRCNTTPRLREAIKDPPASSGPKSARSRTTASTPRA